MLRRPAIAVVAIAATVVLAACGSSSPKTNGVDAKAPDAIVAASKQAADTATSVHVAGSITSGGQPTTFDLRLVKGQGGSGNLSVNGLSFDLVRIGSTIYVKGSPAFYQKFAGAAAPLLVGKWLKGATTGGSFGDIGMFTDLTALVDQALTRSPNTTLSKGGSTTVAGQSAIQVKDQMGGTLSVATTGQPYPLEIAKGGTGGGTVTFNQWNASVPLTAPPGAVDVDKLTKK